MKTLIVLIEVLYLQFCCIYLGIYVSAEVVSGLLVFCVSRKDRVLGRDFFMLCGIGTVSVKCASELTKITVLVIS